MAANKMKGIQRELMHTDPKRRFIRVHMLMHIAYNGDLMRVLSNALGPNGS